MNWEAGRTKHVFQVAFLKRHLVLRSCVERVCENFQQTSALQPVEKGCHGNAPLGGLWHSLP